MTTLDQLFGAALLVPGALNPIDAAAARERLEPQLTRYALVDRGSYKFVRDPDERALLELATRAAERVTGRSLVVAESRALWLGAGDYLLAHHDRIHDDNPVEVTLDLSPLHVPDAEVHYRRSGQVFFRVPSAPGTLAVVERGVTVTCNHTYVSRLHAAAIVVRLVVLLRDLPRSMRNPRSDRT